jgi:pyruvate formate lyase activating enzyme
MEFARIIPQSFDYWKGVSALVAFAKGRAACGWEKDHLTGEISGADVEKELAKLGDAVKAVVIVGADPLQQSDFPIFCKKMKLKHKKVRFTTGGGSPEALAKLIERRVIDYVELNIKAPLYAEAYGKVCRIDFNKVRDSVLMLSKSGVDHEFSVTLSPALTEADVMDIAAQLGQSKRFVLQAFAPGECADAALNSAPATDPTALRALAKRISGPSEVRVRVGGKEELLT